MKLIPKLLLCSVSAIAACGVEENANDAPAATTATTVDGVFVPLTQTEENYQPASTNSDGLKTVVATITQTFTASTTYQLHITSTIKAPCSINIYGQYERQASEFKPQPDSRLMQINSATCSYSGPIYILNHQQELLVEVIDLQQRETTAYYEIDVTDNPIMLTMN